MTRPPPRTNQQWQQFTQQNFPLQQQTTPHSVTQQEWHRNSSWSYESDVMYATASACAQNYVMSNACRILRMEASIDYLKEMLSKAFDMNVKERITVKALTKDIEHARQINRHLISELRKAQVEKKNVDCALKDVLAAQNELSVNKKELLDAKNDLVSAHNSISDLKATNAILESKVAELQHQGEKKGTDGLSSLPEIFKTVAIKCEYSEKSSPDEKLTSDYEILRSQYDLLKDELASAVQMGNVVKCMFKELGKKHLYMIGYSGEQMYTDYEEKHTKFIGKLNSLKGDSTNDMKCFLLEHTLDCLQQQLKLLEDCRKDFQVSIELLMCRVDQEFALVSDLSIRARKPSFEIPIEDFDQLLQVIAQIGGPELDEKDNLEKLTPTLSESSMETPFI